MNSKAKVYCLFLILISAALFGAEEIKSVRIKNPVNNSFLIVQDDKFQPPVMTLAATTPFPSYVPIPWYTTYATCNFSSKAVFEFGLDETQRYAHLQQFSSTIIFDAIAYDKNYNPTYYTNLSLTITYNPGKGTTYTDRSTWSVPDEYFLDITIKSITTTESGVTVANPIDLYVEGRIESTRDYNLTDFTASNAQHNVGQNYISTSNELEVYWPTLIGAEEYELEWCWVANYGNVSLNPMYDFRTGATRIVTKNNYYRIPLLYEQGHMIYRIRPVGRVCADNTRSKVWGKWTTEVLGIPEYGAYVWQITPTNGNYTYVNQIFESDKFNWESTLTFDENGRKGSGVVLKDALFNSHYDISKLNTEDNIIVSSHLYDFQGRPSVEILPSPFESSKLQYVSYLNKTTTGQFDKTQFDVDAASCYLRSTPQIDPVQSGGASAYYSSSTGFASSQTNKDGTQSFLPDAGQYPYVQTEYTPDLSGRIRSQSEPGATHKLGSGKESEFFYANPGNRELDRLFGTEAGPSSHYKKTIAKDANGQLSVSYLDMNGRVVATALTGDSPSQVDAIPSYATNATVLTENMLLKNTSSPCEKVVNSSIFVDQAGSSQQFVYEFTPLQVTPDCQPTSGICYNCIYEVELLITDECGATVFSTGSNPIIVGTITNPGGSCITPLKFSLPTSPITVTFPRIGNYNVTKKLKVSDVNVDTYWDLYMGTCYKDFNTIFNEQKLLIAQDSACGPPNCAACTTAVNNYVTAHSGVLTADQITALINDCLKDCQNDPCESYRAKMLADMTPNSNPPGQYAQSSSQALSIWGGGNNLVNYQNVIFHDEDGSISNVLNSSGSWVYANQLSITDFIANFQPSWAEDLLPYHPEYCYLQFCNANSASMLYDDAMLNTDTWNDACTNGFLRPLGSSNSGCITSACPNCSSSNPDPFFNTGGAGHSLATDMLLEMTGNFNSNFLYTISLNSTAFNALNALNPSLQTNSSTNPCAYQLAADIAGSNSGNSYCSGISTALQDKVWIAFRTLYLMKKAKMFDIIRTAYATSNGCLNSCIGGGAAASAVTYPNTCSSTIPVGKTANCISQNGYNASLDPLAPCSACSSCASSFAAYTTKIRVFTNPLDILNTDLQSYANSAGGGSSNVQNPVVTSAATSYVSTCTDMADSWMQKIIDCTGGAVAPSTTLYNNIRSNLIAVCAYGASTLDPYGVSSIPQGGFGYCTAPGPSSGSNSTHFNSFQSVLDYYIPGYSTNYPDCIASELLTFPPEQGHSSAFGVTRPLDGCACSQIMDNQHIFLTASAYYPSTITTPSALWNYYTAEQYYLGQPVSSYSNHMDGNKVDFLRPCILSATEYNTLYAACSAVYPLTWDCNSYYTAPMESELASLGLQIPASLECCGLNMTDVVGCTGSHVGYCAPKVETPDQHLLIVPKATTCYEDLINQATNNAYALYEAQFKDKEKFIKNYKQTCIAVTDEKLERTYTLREHNYTLYYYDQAGNLTRTVPPEGVQPLTSSTDFTNIDNYRNGSSATAVFPQHQFFNNSKFTSYNVPESSMSTDEDNKTDFVYDYSGRIVASWNANQKNISPYVFSYTMYDNLSRIVEAGMINSASDPGPLNFTTIQNAMATQPANFTPQAWTNMISGKTKQQVIRTTYDVVAPSAAQWYFPGGQKNLRNRISYIAYYDNGTTQNYATYFSYDAHGNVTTVVQQIGSVYKVMEYEYDLISGNVNKVVFQRNGPDQMIHKYYYDSDNRLHEVFSSKNGIHFDRDAKYFYYKHGALARTELGEGKVNGIDYAYTIHGWLKGMNSAILGSDRDMGKDGGNNAYYMSAKSGVHYAFANDAAGYILNYYDSQTDVYAKDYIGIKNGNSTYDFLANEVNLRTGSNSFFDLNTDAPNLYNGNISSMTSNYFNQDATNVVGVDAYAPQITSYKYDQLNRIKKMKAYRDIVMNTSSGNYNKWNTPTGSNYDGSYQQQFTYDGNGNILSLTRNGATSLVASGLGGLSMDNLAYTYRTPTNDRKRNQLIGVWESASSTYADDYKSVMGQAALPNDGTHATWNYDYDGEGNLIRDNNQCIANILWTNDGKVKSIIRNSSAVAGSNPAVYPPNIEFEYDANRQRVLKIVKPRSNGTSPSPQSSWISTYYVRDASGKVMEVYEKKFVYSGDVNYPWIEATTIKEQNLYGTEQLGVDAPGWITYGTKFSAGINSTTGEFINMVYPLTLGGVSGNNYLRGPIVSATNGPQRVVGRKMFEMGNHLGNVLATISDRKIQFANSGYGSYLCNFNMSTVPNSDLSSTSNFASVNGRLQCATNLNFTNNSFNLRLGSNLPANTTFEIEFDFDPGTLNGNDAVAMIGSDMTTLGNSFNVNNQSPLFFDGTSIPPAGHYKFYYKPDHVGPTYMTCLSVGIARYGATSKYIFIDNVTIRAIPKVTAYSPDILSHTDYYAFGQSMPGRKWSLQNYRYGMNGQEKQDEIFTGAYSAEHWIYDGRIGRRWNLDPIERSWESPYATFGNNPLCFADPDGLAPTTDYKDQKGNLIAHTNDGLDRTVIIPDAARKAFDVAFAAAEKYGVRDYEPTNRRLGADYGIKGNVSAARKITQAVFLQGVQNAASVGNIRSGGKWAESVSDQSATAFHLFYQWAYGTGPNERSFNENSVMGHYLLQTPEVQAAVAKLLKNPGEKGSYNSERFTRSLSKEGKLDYVASFFEDVRFNPTRAFHGSFTGIVKVTKVTKLGSVNAIDIIVKMHDNMTAMSGSRLPPPVGYGPEGSVFNQEYPNGFKGPLKTIVIDYTVRKTVTTIKN